MEPVEEEKQTIKIPVTGAVVKGAAGGLAGGIVILLLFGLLSHRWLVAALAAVCVCVGVFAMVFTLSYFKAAERWYKAHPQPKEKETSAEQEEESRSEQNDR